MPSTMRHSRVGFWAVDSAQNRQYDALRNPFAIRHLKRNSNRQPCSRPHPDLFRTCRPPSWSARSRRSWTTWAASRWRRSRSRRRVSTPRSTFSGRASKSWSSTSRTGLTSFRASRTSSLLPVIFYLIFTDFTELDYFSHDKNISLEVHLPENSMNLTEKWQKVVGVI